MYKYDIITNADPAPIEIQYDIQPLDEDDV